MLTTKVLILLVIGTHACLGENTPPPDDRPDKQEQHHKQHGRDEPYRRSEGKWDKRERSEPREKDYYAGKHTYEHKESKRERSYYDNEIQDNGKTSKYYKEAKWTEDHVKNHEDKYRSPPIEQQNNELTYDKEEIREVRGRRSVEEPSQREVQRSDVENENKRVTIQHLPAFSAPPDPNNTVLMARYIVHSVDWAGLATITSRGYGGAFANVVSISDGTVDDGTGVPYFYVTPMDLSTQDVAKDNRVSVVVTLAQTQYCRDHSPSALDPEDPRCARLILSGKMKRVKPSSSEDEFARNALFTRHPAMRDWPKDHGFYVAKLKIGQVVLLDQFGGPKNIDVKDYLDPQQQRG